MTRTVLSLGNFFQVAHFYLVGYIIAPYLATFMPPEQTGLVIATGGVLTLLIYPNVPNLVTRFGARRLAIAFGAAEAVALLWLSLSPSALAAMLLTTFAFGISPFIGYQLDLLLEANVKDEAGTGRARAAFLTAGNAALILAPLLAGMLLDSGNDYSRVFLLASISLVPFIFLFVARNIPEGVPPSSEKLWNAFARILADRDLSAILLANLSLQLFYSLAPLYIPLYLHDVIGIPWSQLGWMLAVMLLPFVLVEYPAGFISDRYLGDKELLFAGFILAGLAYAFVPVISIATSVTVALGILVATRIGAALVEAMTEGHFFRRVSEKDASAVGAFRAMRPLAAIIGPVIGSILLATTGYGFMFVVSGIVIATLGGIAALRIQDVK